MPRGFELEQVEASVEVAGIKFQHLAKAFRRQIRFIADGIGIAQSSSCADQPGIEREGLQEEFRALLGFALLQTDRAQHGQGQRPGQRGVQRLSGFSLGVEHVALAQQLCGGFNVGRLSVCSSSPEKKKEEHPWNAFSSHEDSSRRVEAHSRLEARFEYR